MKYVRILLFAALATNACNSVNDTGVSEIGKSIQVPESTGDGWQVASVESVGMDSVPLEIMMARLDELGDHRIHSILIVKENKLVFEKYYPGRKFNLAEYTGELGFSLNDPHNLASATKSITSALLGIAIDQGFVQSVDQNVFDFFPEHSDLLVASPGKRTMTIRHLLTMTSGLEWDDESLPYSDSRNDMHRMFVSGDPIRFVLAKPLFQNPGAVFDYDNCNTNVIGEIIHRATDQRLDRFAKTYLFDKLGMTQFEWQMIRNDVVFCSGDVRLRPRDMAKIGLLFLNNGEWNGEQLISKLWCEVSTASHVVPNQYTDEFPWAQGYGFQWWRKTYRIGFRSYESYFASGWGGQNIIILPGLDVVVVTTGGSYYDPEVISAFTIVSEYVIPSVIRQ